MCVAYKNKRTNENKKEKTNSNLFLRNYSCLDARDLTFEHKLVASCSNTTNLYNLSKHHMQQKRATLYTTYEMKAIQIKRKIKKKAKEK